MEMDYETRSCSNRTFLSTFPSSARARERSNGLTALTRSEISQRERKSVTQGSCDRQRSITIHEKLDEKWRNLIASEEGVSGGWEKSEKEKKKKKRVRYLSKEEERSEKESSEWKVITRSMRNRKGMMIYTDYPGISREKKLRIN